METKTPDTLERIQQAALNEFSEKGFLGASLRQIVKHAGVTTGAFYGYFSSKEALFASIVEPHAAILMSKYVDAHIYFSELPAEEQPEHMAVESEAYIHWMVEYVCHTGNRLSCCFVVQKALAMKTLFITWLNWKWKAPLGT